MKVFLAFQRVAFSGSMKNVIEKATIEEFEEEIT